MSKKKEGSNMLFSHMDQFFNNHHLLFLNKDVKTSGLGSGFCVLDCFFQTIHLTSGNFNHYLEMKLFKSLFFLNTSSKFLLVSAKDLL
jgi:hypothetical protein